MWTRPGVWLTAPVLSPDLRSSLLLVASAYFLGSQLTHHFASLALPEGLLAMVFVGCLSWHFAAVSQSRASQKTKTLPKSGPPSASTAAPSRASSTPRKGNTSARGGAGPPDPSPPPPPHRPPGQSPPPPSRPKSPPKEVRPRRQFVPYGSQFQFFTLKLQNMALALLYSHIIFLCAWQLQCRPVRHYVREGTVRSGSVGLH